METFRLFKAKYIDEKLNFLNQLRYRKQFETFMKDDPTQEEKLRYEQYSDRTWEAMNSVINAANLMCDYVAQCAMERIHDKNFTCLIVSDNTIEDADSPIFAFEFQFMVVPKLESLADKSTRLDNHLNEISCGRVCLEEMQAELEFLSLPFGEIVTNEDCSDWKFMHTPLSALIDDLYAYAMADIESFKNGGN